MQAQRAVPWSQVLIWALRIPQSPLAAAQLTQLFPHPTLSSCHSSRTLGDLFLISFLLPPFLLITLPHVTGEKASTGLWKFSWTREVIRS